MAGKCSDRSFQDRQRRPLLRVGDQVLLHTVGRPYIVVNLLAEDAPYVQHYVSESLARASCYFREGRLHCDSGPAVRTDSGEEQWWVRGMFHRDGDQPAIIGPTRTIYARQGMIHRENDQPATIYADGHRSWRQWGLHHRDGDQPAKICSNGTMKWYCRGWLHRDGDRPAIVRVDVNCGYAMHEWWEHGRFIRSDSPNSDYTPPNADT